MYNYLVFTCVYSIHEFQIEDVRKMNYLSKFKTCFQKVRENKQQQVMIWIKPCTIDRISQ